jgi:hypothetical protein
MYFIDGEVFVDDRIINAESEGRLHKAVSKLRQAVGKGNSNISPKKAKVMTLAEMNQLKQSVL